MPEEDRSFLAGEPTGEAVVFPGNLSAYIARPKVQSDRALLILHDAFGWKMHEMRRLADKYAERLGCLVILPDLYGGMDAPISNMEFMFKKKDRNCFTNMTGQLMINMSTVTWIKILFNNQEPVVTERMYGLCNALKEAPWGLKHIGVLGYDFGSTTGIKLASTEGGGDFVKGYVSIDPISVAVPGDLEKLSKPTLFLVAEKGKTFPKAKRDEASEFMKNKEGAAVFELVEFEKMTPGFAVRWADNDECPEEKLEAARKDTFDRTSAFFDKHLLEK